MSVSWRVAGCAFAAWLIVGPAPAAPKAARKKPPVRLDAVGRVTVWKTLDPPGMLFTAGMAIDADGAPDAYHPEDTGLDALKNAGRPGNWWAIVTNTGKGDGTPIQQGPGDPFPGYYVSTTSLEDRTRAERDPRRFVNASTIPYVVLPPQLQGVGRARLGDFAMVVNTRNGRISPAILADTGPRSKIGEGSIALAKALGIPASPRTGGVDRGVIYLIFPGSGNGKPRPLVEIGSGAMRLFDTWGGLVRLRAITRLSANG